MLLQARQWLGGAATRESHHLMASPTTARAELEHLGCGSVWPKRGFPGTFFTCARVQLASLALEGYIDLSTNQTPSQAHLPTAPTITLEY